MIAQQQVETEEQSFLRAVKIRCPKCRRMLGRRTSVDELIVLGPLMAVKVRGNAEIEWNCSTPGCEETAIETVEGE